MIDDHILETSKPGSADHASDSFARPVFGTAGLKMLGLGLGFLTNIFLARQLGSREFGLLAYVLAWVTLLKVVGTFGLDRLLVMQTAVYHLEAAWDRIHGLMRWALLVSGLASLLAVVPFAFIRNDNDHVLVMGAALILVTAVFVRLLCAQLQGFSSVVHSQLAEGLVQPGAYLFLITACLLLTSIKVTARTAIWLCAAAGVCTCGFCIRQAWQRFPRLAFQSRPVYDSRRWITLAIPLLFVGLLDAANSQVSSIALGSLSGTATLGIYAAADRLAQLVVFPLVVTNTVLAPRFAGLFHEERRNDLQTLVTKSARITFACSSAIAIVLLLGGQFFLRIFGTDFVAGMGPLVILCIGQMVNSFLGSVAYLLIMTGHGHKASVGVGAGVLVNISLSLVLIPRLGALGAAIASASALTVWNVVLAIFVWRRLRIATTALGTLSFNNNRTH